MIHLKSKEDDQTKIEKLEQNKKALKIRIDDLQKEIEQLEEKVGMATKGFRNATSSDLMELENAYDVIELYENQIKDLDRSIEKLKEKQNKRNKR